jgi:hypothetical protein
MNDVVSLCHISVFYGNSRVTIFVAITVHIIVDTIFNSIRFFFIPFFKLNRDEICNNVYCHRPTRFPMTHLLLDFLISLFYKFTISPSDAQSNNLPTLEYVLYPKPSGLLCCLSTLKEIRENLNMKRSSENNGNNQNNQYIGSNMNGNGRVTVDNGNSNVSNVTVMAVEVKEHKADCVPYVRAESKDGYQKEKEQKNIEPNDNLENLNIQKNSVNEKERRRDNNGNERETILALHDLTVAYTDYTKGKKNYR